MAEETFALALTRAQIGTMLFALKYYMESMDLERTTRVDAEEALALASLAYSVHDQLPRRFWEPAN